MNKLFNKKEWIGEFFLPDKYESRFPGKIIYSPVSGVILEYNITITEQHEIPDESDVLYGMLDNGKKCTLIGTFSPQHSGMRGFNTRFGKNEFIHLVIGDFVQKGELFYEVNFSLTNMQEFFFPNGFKDLVKFTETPLFSLKTPYGEIEVIQNATFTSLQISSQIYSHNKSAINELEACFSEIKSRHPHCCFMLKKDIAYYFRMKINDGATIRNIFKFINDIANLFAILTYNPVCLDSINIFKKVIDEHPIPIEIYPTMLLEQRTIDLCTKDKSHFNMPIKNINIDLSAVLTSWINSPKDYSTIVTSIQHETGFRDEHSIHGEILLFATQLESISYNQKVSKINRYEYPIERYASEKVKSNIRKIFSKIGENKLGKGIGDLRNEIAHIGKPRKILLSFSLMDMVDIGQILQMIIIGYILEDIGITKELINEYQNKFTPEV